MRIVLALLIGMLLAVAGVAQADSYRLRPGDVLDVSVWQDPKLNRQIVVSPDGLVSFPLAGRFRAGGLTTAAVESALRSKLQKQFSTELDITVSYVQSEKRELKEAEVEEFTVYVTGEVNKPGSYVVSKEPPTVLQALALSGGLGPFAAARRITVRRTVNSEERVFTFDYKRYSKGQDTGRNIMLQDGDVVVVPERGLFE